MSLPFVVTDLIGKPFAVGGRGLASYDCAGLVVEMMRRRGIVLDIPETPDDRLSQHAAMLHILNARWIDIQTSKPGCVVFFRPNHVGVMLSPYNFIHCAEDVGQVCIDRLEGPIWPRRLVGFYEYGGPR